jgi:hypothetical protein
MSRFAVKALGVLLAVVPFAFASMRLFATGVDLRYLWMAFVSTLCAAGVLLRSSSPTVPSRARTGLATIAAATCAAAAAIMLGATAGPGIAIVALAFGLCSALGTGLVLRARSRPTG